MLAAIHVNHAEHQRLHGEAMREGLARHGIRCEIHGFDAPAPCDFAVIWGWHQPRINAAPAPHLVMELGHLQPRESWTSLGWGGLAGRGRYAEVEDAGARFQEHFAALMQPQRQVWEWELPVLICGQVPGDAAIAGIDFPGWVERMTRDLLAVGQRVRYRPHPRTPWKNWHPDGADLSREPSLAADLARSKFVVTWNSTAGTDAVLAGVPTVAMDEGSMAWDVTAHSLREVGSCLRPDRAAWAARLAWCQFSLDEIRSGFAWEHLRHAAPADLRNSAN